MPQPGAESIFQAANFSDASGSCIISSGIVTGTAAGTALDYPISINAALDGILYFNYSYTGSKSPELELSMIKDGTETVLAAVKLNATL